MIENICQTTNSITEVAKMAEIQGLPVIIYGAGIIGDQIFEICVENGIDIDCFCDSSSFIDGKKKFGLDIVDLQSIRDQYRDALFLIGSVDIRAAISELDALKFRNWFPGGRLLEKEQEYQTPNQLHMNWKAYQTSICIESHQAYVDGALFVRSAEVIITERCSLKCKDCSNLMQYYTDPKHCDVSLILKSLSAFFASVDDILEFRILGGEPFLNHEWPRVVQQAIDEPKVRRIVVITNGTIVPIHAGWECLKDPKVRLNISNYGSHSRKYEALIDFAEQNGIRYWVYKAEVWNDCAQVRDYGRSEAENKEVFRHCWSKNIWTTLSDGKLYRCPYAANVERLEASPHFSDDHIDLLDMTISPQDLKVKVKDYLLYKESLKTCGFCSGVVLNRNVEPALQTYRPLSYQRY